ncbi:MAG: hypothetical protein MJA27_18535 [Pseudanabaenales cyanobacterium]|nr:hypothetical protein [Pseudanabaenales cyanobacterium]
MTAVTNTEKFDYKYYDKYYKDACEVSAPIILKVPVYVTPVVIEKDPVCVEKKY